MRPAAIAIVVAAIVVSKNARATECPAPEGGSERLRSIDAERRLTYVEGALSRAGEQSAKWGGFWRAAFSTSAALQFGLVLAAKKDADRIDLVAGGIKSTVGFTFALLFRLPAERHHEPWAERAWEQGPVCARLASAEAALSRDATFERRGRSLGMQGLGIAFNLAVGITQYVLHHRLWSVLTTTVSGAIVGETRIFTQPTVASESYESYLAGTLGTATTVSIVPTIVPVAGGAEMGVAVTF